MRPLGTFPTMKKHLLDFVTFRRMIAPVLLQIMFWPAAFASVYYSVWLILEGNSIGWIPLIAGTLFMRVVFEVTILFFRILEELSDIHVAVEADESGASGRRRTHEAARRVVESDLREPPHTSPHPGLERTP